VEKIVEPKPPGVKRQKGAEIFGRKETKGPTVLAKLPRKVVQPWENNRPKPLWETKCKGQHPGK